VQLSYKYGIVETRSLESILLLRAFDGSPIMVTALATAQAGHIYYLLVNAFFNGEGVLEGHSESMT